MPPIPTTGTFRLLVKAVSQRDNEWGEILGNPSAQCDPALTYSNATIASYLNADGGAELDAIYPWKSEERVCSPGAVTACKGPVALAGLYGFRFIPATDEIIFNPGGSQEIVDFLSSRFPKGFLGTALQLRYFGTADIGLGPNIDLRFYHFGVVIDTLAAPTFTNDEYLTPATAIVGNNLYKGAIQSLASFGLDVNLQDLAYVLDCAPNPDEPFTSPVANVGIRNFYFQGEYLLWSATLELNPQVAIPADPLLSPSEPLTITDGDNGLDQIVDLFAYYRNADGSLSAPFPITDITTHTAGTIVFTLPSFAIPSGASIIITGSGDGVEFTGEINLGFLLTTLVDGSGLYKLNFDKHYDTYYDRSVTPVVTVDVAIPEPFGRNGFF